MNPLLQVSSLMISRLPLPIGESLWKQQKGLTRSWNGDRSSSLGTRRSRPRAGPEVFRPWRTRVKVGHWGYLQISPVRDGFRRMRWKKGANAIDNTGSATFGFFSALTTTMHYRQFYVSELICLPSSLYHVVEVPSSEGSKRFFRKPPTPSCTFSNFSSED